MHVDAAADAKRVVSRVKKIIHRRYGLPSFCALIQRARFQVVVLCPSEGKKLGIEKLAAKKLPDTARCRVVVVEPLQCLLEKGSVP